MKNASTQVKDESLPILQAAYTFNDFISDIYAFSYWYAVETKQTTFTNYKEFMPMFDEFYRHVTDKFKSKG